MTRPPQPAPRTRQHDVETSPVREEAHGASRVGAHRREDDELLVVGLELGLGVGVGSGVGVGVGSGLGLGLGLGLVWRTRRAFSRPWKLSTLAISSDLGSEQAAARWAAAAIEDSRKIGRASLL